MFKTERSNNIAKGKPKNKKGIFPIVLVVGNHKRKVTDICSCAKHILFETGQFKEVFVIHPLYFLDFIKEKIETIKGLGFITIIKVLTETNGFLLFKSIRQLVSYAGLDVIEKESGKYIGKTKISKKGNARIRSALYMPAMSAAQHNRTLKVFYNRINESRTIKKQGLIAVMRKLLILIYTLWKKEEEYIENYQMT